ncbi:MAG: CHASE2 domain-containing protein [Pseudomonadota bacterium]|nr:CHASE2 domain-containing protein [Pseudomonadota bacterium]
MAAAVVFDVLFAEPDRTSPKQIIRVWQRLTKDPELTNLAPRLPDNDQVLARFIAKIPTVLAFILTDDPNLSKRPRVNWGVAVAGGNTAFGEATGLNKVHIGRITVPTDANGQIWIYDSGHVPERFIPAWRVMAPGNKGADVEGRIVIIGTSAAGLKDIRSTALNPVAAGVEIQAQALDQINGEVVLAVKPASNRAILFDARIPHVGRAPSRFYGGLRVTVAFKLIVADDSSQ